MRLAWSWLRDGVEVVVRRREMACCSENGSIGECGRRVVGLEVEGVGGFGGGEWKWRVGGRRWEDRGATIGSCREGGGYRHVDE